MYGLAGVLGLARIQRLPRLYGLPGILRLTRILGLRRIRLLRWIHGLPRLSRILRRLDGLRRIHLPRLPRLYGLARILGLSRLPRLRRKLRLLGIGRLIRINLGRKAGWRQFHSCQNAIARPAGCHVEPLRLLLRGITGGGSRSGAGMRTIGRGLVRVVAERIGGLDQRIGQDAARSDVNDPPFRFAGHRIDVALAQEANVASGFQVVERLWIRAEFAVEKLDGTLVLHAAADQHLFAGALGFEGNARHLHVKRDADDGGKQEHHQEREAGFLVPFHPAISASSGSVCWLLVLNCVSSTTAEFTPMRTIL